MMARHGGSDIGKSVIGSATTVSYSSRAERAQGRYEALGDVGGLCPSERRRVVVESDSYVGSDPGSPPRPAPSPVTLEAHESYKAHKARQTPQAHQAHKSLDLKSHLLYITSTGLPVTNLPCGKVVTGISRDAAQHAQPQTRSPSCAGSRFSCSMVFDDRRRRQPRRRSSTARPGAWRRA
jgi:hypothetical protein